VIDVPNIEKAQTIIITTGRDDTNVLIKDYGYTDFLAKVDT
jgi:hypothetical protein